jgi:hypothetical protein
MTYFRFLGILGGGEVAPCISKYASGFKKKSEKPATMVT